MGTILFVYYLFLVFSCQLQGSTAKTPVFVKKGEDVVLELMRHDVPKAFLLLLWQFNKTDTLVTFTSGTKSVIFEAYEGRVETFATTYSVKLKNLQDADSGVYIARVTAAKEQVLAEYNIIVQDPVSPVHLTVNSVSNSSDYNLTVTCRTQDSHHIHSTCDCDAKTCSQEEGERSKATTSGASLRVYLSEGFIICNHSNQVSWTQDNKTTEQFCPQHKESLKTRERDIVIVSVVFLVFGCVVVCLFFLYRVKKRKDDSESTDNTVYATCEETRETALYIEVEMMSRVDVKTNTNKTISIKTTPNTQVTVESMIKPNARPQCPTTNNASSPNTVYAVVGPHTGPTETRASP